MTWDDEKENFLTTDFNNAWSLNEMCAAKVSSSSKKKSLELFTIV